MRLCIKAPVKLGALSAFLIECGMTVSKYNFRLTPYKPEHCYAAIIKDLLESVYYPEFEYDDWLDNLYDRLKSTIIESDEFEFADVLDIEEQDIDLTHFDGLDGHPDSNSVACVSLWLAIEVMSKINISAIVDLESLEQDIDLILFHYDTMEGLTFIVTDTLTLRVDDGVDDNMHL